MDIKTNAATIGTVFRSEQQTYRTKGNVGTLYSCPIMIYQSSFEWYQVLDAAALLTTLPQNTIHLIPVVGSSCTYLPKNPGLHGASHSTEYISTYTPSDFGSHHQTYIQSIFGPKTLLAMFLLHADTYQGLKNEWNRREVLLGPISFARE